MWWWAHVLGRLAWYDFATKEELADGEIHDLHSRFDPHSSQD
jgi:hypothetical protein